jgi:RNA polymerase sigma-70 factor (ECF subfamily)
VTILDATPRLSQPLPTRETNGYKSLQIYPLLVITHLRAICKLLPSTEEQGQENTMDQFGNLLEAEIPRLRRYARVLTRDASRADDLVQNCLLLALTKCHLWQPGTNLRAWLFTILHNQHVNDLRKSRREGLTVPVEDVAPKLRQAARQEGALQLRDLDRAIQQLPEGQRTALLLVGLEDMSYEDAAKVLDIPVGTLRSRLFRGREMLRELLDMKTPAHEPA